MNRPNLATLKTCTGCLVCIDVCPKMALSKCIGEDGHIYILNAMRSNVYYVISVKRCAQ